MHAVGEISIDVFSEEDAGKMHVDGSRAVIFCS